MVVAVFPWKARNTLLPEIATAFRRLVFQYIEAVVWYHKIRDERAYQPAPGEYEKWQRVHRELTSALRRLAGGDHHGLLTNMSIEVLDRY
jgi:hypothetical protein